MSPDWSKKPNDIHGIARFPAGADLTVAGGLQPVTYDRARSPTAFASRIDRFHWYDLVLVARHDEAIQPIGLGWPRPPMRQTKSASAAIKMA